MKLIDTKFGRQAVAAALILSAAAVMSTGAFAAEGDDTTVAGYRPAAETPDQGILSLYTGTTTDVAVGEKDPTFGGYASPVENPIQGDIMLISAPDEELPVETAQKTVRPAEGLTMKGLFCKQVLFTARQEGHVLSLAAPDTNITLRGTIGDLRTQMAQGVSTLSVTSEKRSTTLNLTLMCDGYDDSTTFTLRHIGDRAYLTIGFRSRRDLLIGR